MGTKRVPDCRAPSRGVHPPTHTSSCAHGTCTELPLLQTPGTEVSSLRARCQCQGQPFLAPSSSSPGPSTRSSHTCSSTCPDTARGLCPPSCCSPAAEGSSWGSLQRATGSCRGCSCPWAVLWAAGCFSPHRQPDEQPLQDGGQHFIIIIFFNMEINLKIEGKSPPNNKYYALA